MRIALLFALLRTGFAAVSLDAGFEGGSTGRIEQVSPVHYRVAAAGEKDQDGRNRQANWYYFRVDGARPGEQLTFDIVNLPGEYNYRPNRGAITKDTPPVISYDQSAWRHVDTFEYQAEEPKLRLRITPSQSRFWIAHVPPYTNAHLDKLRERIRRHPDFHETTAGQTVRGRQIPLWTIASRTTVARKTVWLMFRQHSWETGSSWSGEGAVLALLADDPNGRRLRQDVIWKIFPLCDPDGVARGGVRFNVHGYDLNRNWDVDDSVKMPEIAAQRGAIARWIGEGGSIALFLSLHNTETSEYLEAPPQGAYRDLAARFYSLLKEHTSFHPSRALFHAEDSTTAGKPGRMNVIQGLYRDWKIPAFLMEQRIAHNEKLKRLPRVEDRLRFGGELVRAAWAAVTETTYPGK
jgi:hypothetical protein